MAHASRVPETRVGARLEVIAENRISVTVPRVETTDLIRLCAAGAIFAACAAILWKLWRPARRSKLAAPSTTPTEPVVDQGLSLLQRPESAPVDPNLTADGLFVVDPVLLASETQAWLDQDWFGLQESSERFAASDAHVELEPLAPLSISAAPPSPVTEHFITEPESGSHAASEIEDAQAHVGVEGSEPAEPWQDAAIASIPSKKEAKKAARLADAEAAREAARVKKQVKRDAKASRRKQSALAVPESDEAFSLTPFTALPVKPPTKREVRNSVRTAAKEVKALRRQEREAEKAAELVQRKLREAEKAAAEEAVRKKLASVAAAAAEQAAVERAAKMSAWEAAAVEMGAATPAPLPNPWGEAVVMAPPVSHAAQQGTPSAWETATALIQSAPTPVVTPAPVVALGEFFAPAPIAVTSTPASSPSPSGSSSGSSPGSSSLPTPSPSSDAWQSSAMAGFWETAPVVAAPKTAKDALPVESPVDINKFGLPEPLPVRKAAQPEGPQFHG